MVLSFVGYVALLYHGGLHRSDLIAVEVIGGLVVVLLSMALGKVFGTFLARRSLQRSVEQLRRRAHT